MSIEFRINQYDEERCYSNGAIDLKSFLTALYSDEHPYGALLNLDGNKRIEPADYAYDEQSGKETYDIDFDRDTITRHEKGKQFKLNEMSKIPLGAAYSLMRFHGAGVPAAVSDCEYDEYNDMSGLFGNRDSEIKERGFVIYSNDEYFEAYLNYLKNTGGYQFIRFANVSGSQYIAFSQRGFDNIKSFLMQKLQTKREEADRLEAEINEAFSAAEPTEIPKDEKSELSELIEKLGLQSHSYTFSVVSLDSEIYVTGAYVESADELSERGVLPDWSGMESIITDMAEKYRDDFGYGYDEDMQEYIDDHEDEIKEITDKYLYGDIYVDKGNISDFTGIQISVNTALQASITPIGIDFEMNRLRLGENYCCIFAITDYPSECDYGWLSKLTNIPGTIVSINSEPIDNGEAVNGDKTHHRF